MEDRNIVGGKIVYAIGAPQTNSFERFEERLVQLKGGDYAGVVMAMAHCANFVGHCVCQLRGRHLPYRRRNPVGTNAATRRRGDIGERQQPVGHIENRRRHAIANSQVRHFRRSRAHVPQRLSPIALARGSGGLRQVAKDGQRARGATPANAAQRDRTVVLRLIDHDVAVRERCAVEQRVGFIHQVLVGRRPLPLLATWPRQQMVDQLDG